MNLKISYEGVTMKSEISKNIIKDDLTNETVDFLE